MEHTRRTSTEGWRMLAVVAVVAPALGLGSLIFDMGTVWRTIWTLIVIFVSGVAVVYSVLNIRNKGMFVCRLTEEEFSQAVPVSSCGESFRINLSNVTQIEIHDGGGEGPSDEWYLHTKEGRHRITSNYGNPYRKFGSAIQKMLPHIETAQT